MQGISRYAWVDGSGIGEPERAFVRAMIYMTILDAHAVARGETSTFVLETRSRAAKGRHSQGWRLNFLKKQAEDLREWVLRQPRFSWYCRLLGWEPREGQGKILEVLDGRMSDTIGRELRKFGIRKRWDEKRSQVERTGAMSQLPIAAGGGREVRVAVWEPGGAEEDAGARIAGAFEVPIHPAPGVVKPGGWTTARFRKL
jgi:hypothetical protein